MRTLLLNGFNLPAGVGAAIVTNVVRANRLATFGAKTHRWWRERFVRSSFISASFRSFLFGNGHGFSFFI
jgi:hypothetical protein